jgi:hypothetical protein
MEKLMAGVKGKSGLPGNQNGFKHGPTTVQNRRADDALNLASAWIKVLQF